MVERRRSWQSRWAWAIVHRELAREGHAGRLVYVTRSSRVIDVGPATRDDFVGLAWATRVAYRLTRDRPTRSRLASLRDGVGLRLDAVARRVETEDEGDDSRWTTR